METVPFVGRQLVEKYRSYPQLISAVKRALQEYSANRDKQPLRTAVAVGNTNGTFLTMPSYSSSDNALVTKLVGLYPDNVKLNLPTHHCYCMLFDPSTGILKCLMEGETITAMRTAAASVAATQVVVQNPPKILAVLGCGLQAKSHIIAFSESFKFEKIKIWGRDSRKALVLCDEFDELPMENCETTETAVRDADVVVTVTHASEPILLGKWLKDGSHVNCVGACRPMWRECDDECLNDAVVYVDSRESALAESGDVILSKCEIYAEIGEILLGEKNLKPAKRTFFKSLGIALEDAAAANLVWQGVQNEEKTDLKS